LNTHPSLSDRLVGLKQTDCQFEATQISAAESIFANRLTSIADQLDYQWRQEILPLWEQEYQQLQLAKQQLEQLESMDSEVLTAKQHWDLINLGERFNRLTNPLESYLAYLKKHPQDPQAALAVGRLMLENKNDEGLEYLKLAIKKDELIENVSILAYEYLVSNNCPEEANNWLSNVLEMEEIFRKASYERLTVKPKELMQPNDFDEKKYEAILKPIKQHKKVKHLWVAQKKLTYLKDSPFFIFAIKEKSGFYLSDKLVSNIMKEIEIPDAVTLVIIIKSHDAKLFKQVKKLGHQLL